jgi:hypothetical protein
METLKEQLKLKRPTLSDNSLTTYASILKNLHRTVFNSDEIDMTRFNETDKILDAIKLIDPKKRKTIISALMVITNDKKKFKDIRTEEPINEQTLTDGPQPVAVPFDISLLLSQPEPKPEPQTEQAEETSFQSYIREVYDNLKNDAELAYKKKSLSTADYQLIQSFVIVSLLGGIHIKPRKSKDYVEFKIKNVDAGSFVQRRHNLVNVLLGKSGFQR